jgi:type II secretory pathway pseudopilin PulG
VIRRASDRRAERGNALVLVLLAVVVIAIVGTAVLSQQSSAIGVQRIYRNVRELNAAFDGRVDALVQSMRYDASAGVPAGGGLCANTAPSWGGLLDLYPDPVTGRSYELHCAAVAGAGPAARAVDIAWCEAGSQCGTGAVRLVARVRFVDQAALGATVRVHSWVRYPSS